MTMIHPVRDPMFGITRAPEIDRPGLVWFNTPRPLSLAALRGRLVILDFWTSCCVNCRHTLPILSRIEEMFAAEATVIGIHSPKFPAESDPRRLAQAIRRCGVRHPVIHDPGLGLWDDYAARAWPTLVFVAPDGHVIGQLSGEPHPELLIEGVGDMLRDFRQRGDLKPQPPFDQPPAQVVGRGRLSFPGKIKAAHTAAGRAWAVADSGHNQVVLFDDDGEELARYGSGVSGRRDGAAGQAGFCAPQGLACDGNVIYVADTGNHAIRRIDRATGTVVTVAGAGARGGALQRGVPGTRCLLASPWDVEIAGGRVFFANAGTHQIGVLDPASGEVRPFAGSGVETIEDGVAATAGFAQPSGLTLSADGRALYVVDAESSALRAIDIASGRATTLAGHGLFVFGHRGGDADEALMQHPLGVAAADGRIFVADSFNDTLRVFDLGHGRLDDIGGLPLFEPAGIAADGPRRLLVSDTNNHRILACDPSDGSHRIWAE